MSKDCGLSEAAEKLNGAIDGAKDAVDDLVGDAVEGIAGAVDGLLDKITGLTDGIKADLEAAVPEIELPEAKLQDMMTKMMSTNDPGEMMTQFAEIKEKFGGTPGIDLDKMMNDFGLDPEKLNAGLADFKDKLGKGDALKQIKDKANLKDKLLGGLGKVADKLDSVADSDLMNLASGDLGAIGKLADGFAGFIMGDEDKAGLLEKICTKLANVEKEAPTDYVIQKGDTLTSIAKAHDTTVQALVELNDIKDPDKIFAGDTIKIPGKVVVKAVEGKAPTEDAKPEPEPEETKPKPKADTKPEVTESETQRAQTYITEEPEKEEVEQFDFGPIIRDDAKDSLIYLEELNFYREQSQKLRKSQQELADLQHEFRVMAAAVAKDPELAKDPMKYLGMRNFDDKIIEALFIRELEERLRRSRRFQAKQEDRAPRDVKHTYMIENGHYDGISWYYNDPDASSYHNAFRAYLDLYQVHMRLKYGKTNEAGKIEFMVGSGTYVRVDMVTPGEKYTYPYEEFSRTFYGNRPGSASLNREDGLIVLLKQLSHIIVQEEDPFFDE